MTECCDNQGLPDFGEGTPGSNGFNAFNRLRVASTQVDVGESVSFSLYFEAPYTPSFTGVGMVVCIPSVGFYQVTAVSSVGITVTRIEGDSIMPEVADGVAIPINSYIFNASPAGDDGSPGPIGPSGENGIDTFVIFVAETQKSAAGSFDTTFSQVGEAEITGIIPSSPEEGDGFKIRISFTLDNAPGVSSPTPVNFRVRIGASSVTAVVVHNPVAYPLGGIFKSRGDGTGTCTAYVELVGRIDYQGNLLFDGFGMDLGNPEGSSAINTIPKPFVLPRKVLTVGSGVGEVDLSGNYFIYIDYQRVNAVTADYLYLNSYDIWQLRKKDA